VNVVSKTYTSMTTIEERSDNSRPGPIAI